MRIAGLDTSKGDDCLSGWSKITTPSPETLKVCRASSDDAGCHQVIYSTYGLNYSLTNVCGMAKVYQKGTPDAFTAFRLLERRTTISQAYVDGLSIIINNNIAKHVWSFGVGHSQNVALCPCSVILTSNVSDRVGREPQQFVKNNYYCDSGNPQHSTLECDTYVLHG